MGNNAVSAMEILDIDFSKYEWIILDYVIIRTNENTQITARKAEFSDVVIDVLRNENCIANSFYDKEDKVNIFEVANGYVNGCLCIRRKEKNNGE